MVVKIFVLGRPGCGKSSASYYIAEFAWRKSWSIIRFKDYEILRDMFQADTQGEKFLATEHKGFKILDFSVFDLASELLEKQVQGHIFFVNEKELIIIEFARHDYSKALRAFSADFLQDAYFLFIEADVETCIRRIHERVAQPLTMDDTFVPDDVLRDYYYKDNRQYIASHFKIDYGINKQVEIIDNMGSKQDFAKKVYRFVELILKIEAAGGS